MAHVFLLPAGTSVELPCNTSFNRDLSVRMQTLFALIPSDERCRLSAWIRAQSTHGGFALEWLFWLLMCVALKNSIEASELLAEMENETSCARLLSP